MSRLHTGLFEVAAIALPEVPSTCSSSDLRLDADHWRSLKNYGRAEDAERFAKSRPWLARVLAELERSGVDPLSLDDSTATHSMLDAVIHRLESLGQLQN